MLYPSDNHAEGKLLRLTQQYFLCSASCQSIIRDHMAVYGTLANLPDKVAIHLNDTHPTLVIPELMRILVDEYFFPWRTPSIVRRVCSYTNHTVMPEALETWNEDLFRLKLPRIYAIIKEINERFCREAWQVYPGNWQRIGKMSVISYGQVHMANLAVIGSHSVNGVSKLHSQILRESVFKDFYRMYPERFDNVTNGIAHRRWLCYSTRGWRHCWTNASAPAIGTIRNSLRTLPSLQMTRRCWSACGTSSTGTRSPLRRTCMKKTGQKLDTHSLFDVQIKRLHEYKRQLLNALNIIGLYLDLKDDPNRDVQPITFLFGAKAAPGYQMAKRIIQLLCMLSKEIGPSLPSAKS